MEYPSREFEHDIKESEGNMFNPIFKGNVQGLKHPGMYAFAEPELVGYRNSCTHKTTKFKKNVVTTFAQNFPNPLFCTRVAEYRN